MYVKTTIPALAVTGIPVALLAGTAVALIVTGVLLVLLSAGVFAKRRRLRTLGWPLQTPDAPAERSRPRLRRWPLLLATASATLQAPSAAPLTRLLEHARHLALGRQFPQNRWSPLCRLDGTGEPPPAALRSATIHTSAPPALAPSAPAGGARRADSGTRHEYSVTRSPLTLAHQLTS